MGISRCSFYALPADKPDDTKIVVEMKAIADESRPTAIVE